MALFSAVRDFFADLSPDWLVMAFARPYVAGDDAKAAVTYAQTIWNNDNLLSTVDVLGESSSDAEKVREWVDMYIALQQSIRSIPSAYISLKPTAMGLMISEDECTRNIEAIAQAAKDLGMFFCIDMEDRTVTDYTLKLYRYLRRKGYDAVGTVIQAYLRRSEDDIRSLISDGLKPSLRICKGIYKADRQFDTMAQINDNYFKLVELLLSDGSYPAIATHDLPLMDRITTGLLRPAGARPNSYEWQMLLGVPVRERQRELVTRGEQVRIYIPFGHPADAAAYCRRRFKENPRLMYFILKNIFSRK